MPAKDMRKPERYDAERVLRKCTRRVVQVLKIVGDFEGASLAEKELGARLSCADERMFSNGYAAGRNARSLVEDIHTGSGPQERKHPGIACRNQPPVASLQGYILYTLRQDYCTVKADQVMLGEVISVTRRNH